MTTFNLSLRQALLASVAACSIMGGTNVSAQAQPSESGSMPKGTISSPVQVTKVAAGEATEGVQELVVTARRRSELQRDIPVAVQAVSGMALEQRAIVRLTDLASVVPNFTLSLAANTPSTNLRGFGTYGTQFAQSVGKFVDNVSYSRDIHARIPLFDVERLEALRGPQVLLYGNSATAGALNISTKAPGREFAADGSVSYEFNHNETIAQGGVTLPLGEQASFRLAGLFQNLDKGWLLNTVNGRDEPQFRNRAVRGTLRVEPTDNVRLSLKAEYASVRDRGGTGQQVRQSSLPTRQLNDITLDDKRETNTEGAPFLTPEFQALDNAVYQFDIDIDTGLGTLHSTTAYLDSHSSGAQGNSTNRNSFLNLIRTDYEQFSQEVRLSGSASFVEYTVGGYYDHNIYNAFAMLELNPPGFGVPLPPTSRFFGINQRNTNYSIFADLNFKITDKLSLSTGARYAFLDQSSDQVSDATPVFPHFTFNTSRNAVEATINPALRPNLIALFGGAPHRFNDIERDEKHFQPQVILQYRPNRDLMVYGKYVKGVKQGGVDFAYAGTSRGAFPDESKFQPESARSFEVGMKGITANRVLEYSLTAFDTQFSDLQVQAFLGTAQFVTNVGKAGTRGVEAEITLVPISGLRMQASANYLDATFKNFPGAPCTVAQALATPAGTVCTQNLSGRRTPFQSKYSGTFNISYEFEAGNFQITPAVNVLARSDYSASTVVDPLGNQKAHALVDLSLAIAPIGSGIRASVFAKNLGNIRFKEYGVATPIIPGAYTVYASRGRSIGIQLGFNY